ncbi:MAG TPA: discoidin domain-containing protein [Steroidobacter sp.]|nr:discoidin domain-containing protein [Steroidobacter sp.]
MVSLGRFFWWWLLIGGVAAQPAPVDMQSLDEMDDVASWRSLASDDVSASVHGAAGVNGVGGAVVLEFDLAGTAGYAAATRKLPTTLPEDYEISFWIRGEAQRNHFEVKFVDASGENVWWFRKTNFQFSGDWQQVRVKRRQIEFAWGPTANRTLRRFESIEFVISAGEEGGKGSVWFDRLALKPLLPPPAGAEPSATASSQLEGYPPAHVIDAAGATSWRSGPGLDATLTIDLKYVREFGGIEIDWVKGLHATNYAIEASLEGHEWRRMRSTQAANGGRDSYLLPDSEARYLRITMHGAPRGYGIAEVHVRDLQFGASPNAFMQSLAKAAPRGCYPRAYYEEQTYWTIIGADGGADESMLSEDGALEVRKGSFSIEPMMRIGRDWLRWTDVKITQTLADGYLPIPSVSWAHRQMGLTVTAYTSGDAAHAVTHAVYRVVNPTGSSRRVTLALAVRPFQVNPPAQFLNTVGGVSPIQQIAFEDDVVIVDQTRRVFPRTAPSRFLAAPFEAGQPCEWLAAGTALPRSVVDESGFASGALLYELDVPPRGSRQIVLDLPLQLGAPAGKPVREEEVAAQWREKLNRVEITAPGKARALSDTLRTALGHVLINRDGAALQPGSRSYERSWIRDGAMTSEMLLRLGQDEVVKQFLRWYAPYQFKSGKAPCCVDRRGADPVPENDSQGEFLFLIDETYRYTRDEQLLREMWPAVPKTVAYMDKLRLSERMPKNQTPDRKAFYGLMPASISHEGYAAKPMHSYWDDFWSLAGYESAVRIARTLGRTDEMHQFIESRDQFRSDLYRSLRTAMIEHDIDYLPGSAELGDLDPTSTTIALSPLGEQQMLPPSALAATFERYWQDFTRRRTSTNWEVYTPYEWRNVAAFIRLRWRERSTELIRFFMDDRRPAAWNQWAEVVGREVRSSRFIGDMPHGWVGSDFGRSLLDMFAFERPADEALVLMPGVPSEWTRKGGFGVRNLRTPYGRLTYSLRIEGDRRVLNVEPLEMPNGGVVIAWPEDEHPAGQAIQRGFARWVGAEMRITQLPFTASFDP